jgi:flagellar biosynthesis protein FliR
MPINILAGFVLLMLFIGVMMSAFLDFFAAQMRLFGG